MSDCGPDITYNGSGHWNWTGTSAYMWPYTTTGGTWNTWPDPVPAHQPMMHGWKCTDCGTVMAPWIPTHTCPSTQTTITTTTSTQNTAGMLFKTVTTGEDDDETVPGCE